MKKSTGKIRNKKNGQSMVEMAIVMPILILILCAIVDMGWIFSNQLIISNASRQGVRYAAVNATNTDSIQIIMQKTLETLPAHAQNEVIIEVTFSDFYDVRAGDVKVKISYNLKALTPVIGIFLSEQHVLLVSETIMKVE